MASRSKKRGGRSRPRRGPGGPGQTGDAAEPGDSGAGEGSRAKRRASPGESRPEAPWGSLPLAEILVLAGIALLLWGFAAQNAVTIGVGLALASIGGLELSIREHFGGYRSHTLLLASGAGFATLALAFYLAQLPAWLSLACAAVLFGLAFAGLRRAFRRASGGYTVRIGGFKG